MLNWPDHRPLLEGAVHAPLFSPEYEVKMLQYTLEAICIILLLTILLVRITLICTMIDADYGSVCLASW